MFKLTISIPAYYQRTNADLSEPDTRWKQTFRCTLDDRRCLSQSITPSTSASAQRRIHRALCDHLFRALPL